MIVTVFINFFFIHNSVIKIILPINEQAILSYMPVAARQKQSSQIVCCHLPEERNLNH